MKRNAVAVTLSLALLAALAVGGCGKKQVRQEGEVTPPPAATEAAPAPAPAARPPVREEPIRPAVVEPPPAQTAAVEPAPAAADQDRGLARETTAGLQRIHFDFDKSLIRPDQRETLQKNFQYLNANPGVRIRIEGHCDERGTTEYNLALGERRAKSAFQYLMDLGVDPNRMSVVSYGEEVPLDPAQNEEAWAKNRRAEFVETQR